MSNHPHPPRGVLIICASPSLRMRLANEHIEHEPVVLASGQQGWLEHLERAWRGRGLLPALVLADPAALQELARLGWLTRLAERGVEVRPTSSQGSQRAA